MEVIKQGVSEAVESVAGDPIDPRQLSVVRRNQSALVEAPFYSSTSLYFATDKLRQNIETVGQSIDQNSWEAKQWMLVNVEDLVFGNQAPAVAATLMDEFSGQPNSMTFSNNQTVESFFVANESKAQKIDFLRNRASTDLEVLDALEHGYRVIEPVSTMAQIDRLGALIALAKEQPSLQSLFGETVSAFKLGINLTVTPQASREDYATLISKIEQNPHLKLAHIRYDLSKIDSKQAYSTIVDMNKNFSQMSTPDVLRSIAGSDISLTDEARSKLSIPLRFDVTESVAGYGPRTHSYGATGTQPVISGWESYVAQVKNIEAGEAANYDFSVEASDETRTLAIIPLGHANQLPKPKDAKLRALINGQFVESVGTKNMNAFFADVTALNLAPSARPAVTFIGRQGNNEITLEEQAATFDLSPKEFTVRMGRSNQANIAGRLGPASQSQVSDGDTYRYNIKEAVDHFESLRKQIDSGTKVSPELRGSSLSGRAPVSISTLPHAYTDNLDVADRHITKARQPLLVRHPQHPIIPVVKGRGYGASLSALKNVIAHRHGGRAEPMPVGVIGNLEMEALSEGNPPPILFLRLKPATPLEVADALARRFDTVEMVSSEKQLQSIVSIVKELKAENLLDKQFKQKLMINFDTGHHRWGLSQDEEAPVVKMIFETAAEHLQLTDAMTHCNVGGYLDKESVAHTEGQFALFDKKLEAHDLKALATAGEIRGHVGASETMLVHPKMVEKYPHLHYRFGLLGYGHFDDDGVVNAQKLNFNNTFLQMTTRVVEVNADGIVIPFGIEVGAPKKGGFDVLVDGKLAAVKEVNEDHAIVDNSGLKLGPHRRPEVTIVGSQLNEEGQETSISLKKQTEAFGYSFYDQFITDVGILNESQPNQALLDRREHRLVGHGQVKLEEAFDTLADELSQGAQKETSALLQPLQDQKHHLMAAGQDLANAHALALWLPSIGDMSDGARQLIHEFTSRGRQVRLMVSDSDQGSSSALSVSDGNLRKYVAGQAIDFMKDLEQDAAAGKVARVFLGRSQGIVSESVQGDTAPLENTFSNPAAFFQSPDHLENLLPTVSVGGGDTIGMGSSFRNKMVTQLTKDHLLDPEAPLNNDQINRLRDGVKLLADQKLLSESDLYSYQGLVGEQAQSADSKKLQSLITGNGLVLHNATRSDHPVSVADSGVGAGVLARGMQKYIDEAQTQIVQQGPLPPEAFA